MAALKMNLRKYFLKLILRDTHPIKVSDKKLNFIADTF